MALPPLIPIEHFFDDPEKSAARLSPDGKRLAYLAPLDGRLNVWVRSVGGDDDRPVTGDRRRSIRSYMWSRDGSTILYLQDTGGDENWHILAVGATGGEARDLTPFPGAQAQILARPIGDPARMVVGINNRDRRVFDVYRMGIADGMLELVRENPGNVYEWVVDAHGRVRGALVQSPEGHDTVLAVRGDDLVELVTYDVADRFAARGFTADGKQMLVSHAVGTEHVRLLSLNLQTGAEEVVAEDPDADLASVVRSPWTEELLAAGFMREKLTWQPLDASFADDLRRCEGVQGGIPVLSGPDASHRRWVLTFVDDRNPGATYLYDRTSGSAALEFQARPKLNPEHLAQMQPVSFDARDGLRVHGYLTVPKGVEPSNLPLVLYVHGGPWSRDTWGFNSMAQFLANRGYGVLQVNYRGSTGYGKSFVEAAVGEWAGKMHTDLIDGVEWAVSQGIADRDRIAIYGGSYGGYATLVGMTFTPEYFRCGIDICGPSNLITLIDSFPPYWRPRILGSFLRHCGDPEVPEQRAKLEACSPLLKVDDIRAPLLIAQGANDPRVTKIESDQIVEAMRAKGLEVEYILKDDEGHGFVNPENRLEVYAAMERFLARHLGGRVGSGG